MVCQSRRNGLLGIFHDELSHELFMVYVKDLEVCVCRGERCLRRGNGG